MSNELRQYIKKEMDLRNMRQVDIAKKGRISTAVLSRFLSGERDTVGEKFCIGIARAFKVAPEPIFRMAGILPGAAGKPGLRDQIIDGIRYLNDTNLVKVLEYVEMIKLMQANDEKIREHEKKELREAIDNATPEVRFSLLTYATEQIEQPPPGAPKSRSLATQLGLLSQDQN